MSNPISATISATGRDKVVTVGYADGTSTKEQVFGGCFMAPADSVTDVIDKLKALNPNLQVVDNTQQARSFGARQISLHV